MQQIQCFQTKVHPMVLYLRSNWTVSLEFFRSGHLCSVLIDSTHCIAVSMLRMTVLDWDQCLCFLGIAGGAMELHFAAISELVVKHRCFRSGKQWHTLVDCFICLAHIIVKDVCFAWSVEVVLLARFTLSKLCLWLWTAERYRASFSMAFRNDSGLAFPEDLQGTFSSGWSDCERGTNNVQKVDQVATRTQSKTIVAMVIKSYRRLNKTSPSSEVPPSVRGCVCANCVGHP